MQEKAEPQRLRVYPARVNNEGVIFVKFAPGS
jgi:nitrite reductase/ring-hydroxylating ferredoxin subunit